MMLVLLTWTSTAIVAAAQWGNRGLRIHKGVSGRAFLGLAQRLNG